MKRVTERVKESGKKHYWGERILKEQGSRRQKMIIEFLKIIDDRKARSHLS